MVARIAFALVISLCCRAQTTHAVLTGAVTDESGAVIPAASVTARNVKTGVETKTSSNASGIYVFPALQPGNYRLVAAFTGFRQFELSGVSLPVGARMSVNIRMELGTAVQEVEVSASAEALSATSTSVGNVISGREVLDLPLADRDALGLVDVVAGVSGDNFSGARIGTLNITLDGINVQDNRINGGVASTLFASVDLIEEFKVITSPADAEYGRGSGQIQMITRSGSNKFTGSLFESHRNTILNANNWFNNQRGLSARTGEPLSPRDNLIRNQFGGRLGGPVRKNRTFFHFAYEGQREVTRNAVNSTVYTEAARRGLYRFFPGAPNANLGGANPAVDAQGNPVRPARATGDLQTINVFNIDPTRRGPDSTGNVQRMLSLMPLPNNFLGGDGLNTGRYTWQRGESSNSDIFTTRIDHHFNAAHRVSYSFNRETDFYGNGFLAQPYPTSPGGNVSSRTTLSSLNVTSAVRSNLLNIFRAGAMRPLLRFNAPWEVAGTSLQPKAGASPYLIAFSTITNPLTQTSDPQGRISPVYEWGDDVAWIRNKHAFKGGATARFISSNGFNSFNVMPRVNIGAGGAPVQNFNQVAGIGQNQNGAQNLLLNLSGSVANVVQAFNARGGPDPQFIPGEPKQRTWKQREFAFYFKDDFKVRPSLTLNLGVRWEYYGVPWDAQGRTAGLVGGSAGVFGISGTSLASLFRPGLQNGNLTQVQLVGPNSPNASTRLYKKDWNNWAPAIGFTWGLPWFGKDKTVFRAGYGIGYERNSLRLVDIVSGNQPGLYTESTFTSPQSLDLGGVSLPLSPLGRPLSPVPLTDRTQIVRAYGSGLRTPYVQNWNASIERSFGKSLTLDVHYVGNKGTRLIRGADVNEVNIYETGILDAFLTTQAGGTSPLLNRIFQGLTIPGLGVVNGTNITGSDAVRRINTTAAFLAGNDVGEFAKYLNTTDQLTGIRGGLLSRAGLPPNFIVANPQFASARLTGNFAGSIYHALQVEVNRRFDRGFQLLANYTWSRAFGEEEGSSQEMNYDYRTMRNRRLDRRLMDFHLTHVFKASGVWELPVPVSNKSWIGRAVTGWRAAWIFNLFSGPPMDIYTLATTANASGDNTPDALSAVPKSLGGVVKQPEGVYYFPGLQQVNDPYLGRITTANNIRGRSGLMAIADSSGRVMLANPAPGTLGGLAQRFLEGPGSFRWDMSLIKQFRVTERIKAELRVDGINVTNSPQFGVPDTDINSLTFGQITDAGGTRLFVVGARLTF